MLVLSAMLLALQSEGAATSTNFGIRQVGSGPAVVEMQTGSSAVRYRALGSGQGLDGIASLAAGFGRVTSMRRSAEHNRRVGGVPNSYHLSGRAIDIARYRGVTHGEIAAAMRRSGYRLVEALDEGDHSHFAFDFGRAATPLRPAMAQSSAGSPSGTIWRIVSAPR